MRRLDDVVRDVRPGGRKWRRNRLIPLDPDSGDRRPVIGIEPNEEFIRKAFQSLRPYGGIACLSLPAETRPEFTRLLQSCGLANAQVRESPAGLLLSREGALPGASGALKSRSGCPAR